MNGNVNDEIKQLIEKITFSFEKNPELYRPFITHIRFPKYKAISKNTKIHFDFPVTVLVGKNGCNKTSILQALYGAPHGTSVGDYWFSTKVDKIEEGNETIDRHCFIYGYEHEKANKNVEVIKTRIQNKDNPDYWEPARPSKKYDMEIPKSDELIKAGNKNKTRWDLLEKNIVYCDCKEYVSAYDLFFYHYDFNKSRRYFRKQDFIRERSVRLADVINNKSEKFSYYGIEQIEKNEQLSEKVCKVISNIMGEEYSEIRIVTHRLYTKVGGNKPSKTIWMKKNNKEYSEAFAGTGESRVILLVNDIYHAPSNSLLLVDEPEISLHPSAIYGLKKFLLEQTLQKKHQLIITTHSTHVVKDFPKEAIKIMSPKEDGIDIIENVDYTEAFYEIGERINSEKVLYVEDRLSKWIVDYVIEKMGQRHIVSNLSVKFLPGGASSIVSKNILNSAIQNQQNCYYLLDGDQEVPYIGNEAPSFIKTDWIDQLCGKIDPCSIPENDYETLQELIDYISQTQIKFTPSGNSGNPNKSELRELQINYLKYWKNHIYFLPCTTPEVGLIENIEENIDLSKDKNGKKYFVEKTKEALSKNNVTSEEIFYEQKRYVGKLSKDTKLYQSIESVINKIFEQ